MDEVEERLAGGRLAAAEFADQRQRLAGADVEGDALDGVHPLHRPAENAALDVEADGEVARSATSGFGLAAAARGLRRPSRAIDPSRGTAASSMRV